MAQRNTDTEFWNTKFMRGLKAPYRSFWAWLQTSCNHAGIWEIDIEYAIIRTGQTDINQADAELFFASEITVLKCGEKWFLKNYPETQFKTIFLNPTNTYHWGAIVILQKLALMDNDFIVLSEQLQTPIKPLYSGSKDAKLKIKDILSSKKEISNDIKLTNLQPREEILKIVTDEPVKPKKEPKKKEAAPVIEIIDFNDGLARYDGMTLDEAIAGLKESRKKKKTPMTDLAEKLMRNKLIKLAGNDEMLQIAIIQQTIRCGWTDILPLKSEALTDFSKYKQQPVESKTQAAINLATNFVFQQPSV